MSERRWMWIVGIFLAVLIGILIAPFAMLVSGKHPVGAILLLAHYQSLVTSVLTLAIAVIAFTTYLGLEDRVRRTMTSQIEQLKVENKERVRLLLDLEKSRKDPTEFEGVVARVVTNQSLYNFFKDDIRDVFMGFKEPGQVTQATGALLSDYFEHNPQCPVDSVFRFLIAVNTQTEESFALAQKLTPRVISKIDKDKLLGITAWLFELWKPERGERWRKVLSELVQELSTCAGFYNEILTIIRSRCYRVYNGDHESNWQTKAGSVGQLFCYIRHLDTGMLERWNLYYGYLFGIQDVPNEVILDEQGNRTVTRQIIKKDLIDCAGPGIVRFWEQASDELRVMMVYPDELFHNPHGRALVYGLVIVPRYGTKEPTVPCPNHTLEGCLTMMEAAHNLKVLFVTKSKP